jgi:phage terminase large subunit-like protein
MMTSAPAMTLRRFAPNSTLSSLASLDPTARDVILNRLSPRELRLLLGDWEARARPEQLPPDGDWTNWLFMGGRGAGKTRAGSEWVKGLVLGRGPFAKAPVGRIALVAETFSGLRDVMIEGPSGLLEVWRDKPRPTYVSTRRMLSLPNGAQIFGFSAEDPESLRGPQFEAAWLDELAKWRHADATFDMLQFGLRLGDNPRQMITTTPRPIPLLKRLLAAKGTVVTRSTTAANADNLADTFLDRIVGSYAGNRLGRQELDGELIEDRDDSLFLRSDIDRARVSAVGELSRVVVAVDPAVSGRAGSDACGIVVVGRDRAGHAYVIEDATQPAVRPEVWAKRAVDLFRRYAADRLVVEVNQGGDLVRSVIATVDSDVPVLSVRATRGKWLRAEPVAALYARGVVHHVGAFAALEDEMCDFGPSGLSDGRSPDRLDALVWAIVGLDLVPGLQPRVRLL